jgi:hypothetical protein
LACTELPSLSFQAGKPGVTWDEVKAAGDAHPEDPLAYARGLLGDTLSTRKGLSENRAARVGLGCKEP